METQEHPIITDELWLHKVTENVYITKNHSRDFNTLSFMLDHTKTGLDDDELNKLEDTIFMSIESLLYYLRKLLLKNPNFPGSCIVQNIGVIHYNQENAHSSSRSLKQMIFSLSYYNENQSKEEVNTPIKVSMSILKFEDNIYNVKIINSVDDVIKVINNIGYNQTNYIQIEEMTVNKIALSIPLFNIVTMLSSSDMFHKTITKLFKNFEVERRSLNEANEAYAFQNLKTCFLSIDNIIGNEEYISCLEKIRKFFNNYIDVRVQLRPVQNNYIHNPIRFYPALPSISNSERVNINDLTIYK